jgi:hypothetical protein
MSAVVRTDEWPRREETVVRSTPSASRRLAWLCRRTWSDAPLGRPNLRHGRDTVDEIELGVSGPEPLPIFRTASPQLAFFGLGRARGARVATLVAVGTTGVTRANVARRLAAFVSQRNGRCRTAPTFLPGPPRRTEMAAPRAHLAHVAPAVARTAATTSPAPGRNAARPFPPALDNHWGETGGTLVSMKQEIWVINFSGGHLATLRQTACYATDTLKGKDLHWLLR